jgi:hypothetical protein
LAFSRLLSGKFFSGGTQVCQRFVSVLPNPSIAASFGGKKLIGFSSPVAQALRWLSLSSHGQTVSQSSNFSFKADASGAA